MPPMNTVTPTVKVVPIDTNTEFTPDEGWKLNSINDTVVKGNVQFFAVLVKHPEPKQPVNLVNDEVKKGAQKPKKS